MKKFTIPCIFDDLKVPFDIYIGEPVPDADPLEQQAAWLLRERGGIIPAEVRESFRKLHAIALENEVSFEELCVYALGNTDTDAEPDADFIDRATGPSVAEEPANDTDRTAGPDIAVTETLATVLRHAGRQLPPDGVLTTGRLLETLIAADATADWQRVFMQTGEPA